MGIVKTIWEPCVFGERPSVPLLKVGNGDIWFSTERDWSQECYHGNILEGVILFLLSCTFLVPSLEDTASIFLEIFFSGTIYDVITFLICIIQKRKYLCNEKRYSKMKNVILLCFEKPFKQAAIIFYFIGTLRSFGRCRTGSFGLPKTCVLLVGFCT